MVGWTELHPYGSPLPTEYPGFTGLFGGTDFDLVEARGVYGRVLGGQAVRGEATRGVGVYATATTGTALDVSGKATFSRSGTAAIGIGHRHVDVIVPGGLAGSPLGFASLLRYRTGVHVAAVRPNFPSPGMLRIYLNKPLATSTSVSWIVMG